MALLDDLTRDLRYAARTFRREPAFVAGVVLTFGLVIGTNAAMFGLVQRLMLAAPSGIQDADRVAVECDCVGCVRLYERPRASEAELFAARYDNTNVGSRREPAGGSR